MEKMKLIVEKAIYKWEKKIIYGCFIRILIHYGVVGIESICFVGNLMHFFFVGNCISCFVEALMHFLVDGNQLDSFVEVLMHFVMVEIHLLFC